jgi:hypothetical protein
MGGSPAASNRARRASAASAISTLPGVSGPGQASHDAVRSAWPSSRDGLPRFAKQGIDLDKEAFDTDHNGYVGLNVKISEVYGVELYRYCPRGFKNQQGRGLHPRIPAEGSIVPNWR